MTPAPQNTQPEKKGWLATANNWLENTVGEKWAAGIRLAATAVAITWAWPVITAGGGLLAAAIVLGTAAVRKYQKKEAFKPFTDLIKSTKESIATLVPVFKKVDQKLDKSDDIEKGHDQKSSLMSKTATNDFNTGKPPANVNKPTSQNKNTPKTRV